ncbi:hypothetical protein DRE_06991 [Drechslerella stenobrocha 248]|uniref:SET domain-containing protein n=1 Tax=Drechslerella stenobrocha 248 TaxID=1043628 RepID=W7HJN9_9PEZI|nr:hypothetical protein DRE_06991 [Drechslerella stenobrocha 248]
MYREFLSSDALPAWATFNSIAYNGIRVEYVGGEPVDSGLAVKLQPAKLDSARPLLRVPRHLILCQDMVDAHAKSDMHLREALAAAGPLAMTPRGAIIIFLIMKITNAATLSEPGSVGVKCPWTEYIKFLPSVSVPTCWSEQQRELLKGTSLYVAVAAKLAGLDAEFNAFKLATQNISWCRKVWWDENRLTFLDWLDCDSWLRSRVLQLPDLGLSMIPFLDFCNHRSFPNSFYDLDDDGNIILIHRLCALGQTSETIEEVTINYGEEKSAAEMLFSYGFVDQDRTTASWMALDLKDLEGIGESGQQSVFLRAKQRLLESAPTVLLIDMGELVEWTSDYVWLLCVNPEDGFNIQVLQQNDGSQHLQAFFDNQPLLNLGSLVEVLRMKPLWPVYQLRALTLVEERVLRQLAELNDSEAICGEIQKQNEAGTQIWHVSQSLRTLEKALMEKTVTILGRQKDHLLSSEVVRKYLSDMQADPQEADDDLT